MADPTTDREVALGELQIKAIEASAQVQLTQIESELVAAQAASDWATASMKQTAADAFRGALHDLAVKRKIIVDKIAEMARRKQRLTWCERGENLGEHIIGDMWRAYYSIAWPVGYAGKLVDKNLPVEVFDSNFYQDVRKFHQDAMITVPGYLKNVLSFVNWLFQQRYVMPKVGTVPYMILVDALEPLWIDIYVEMDKWRQVLADAEKGTYTVFDPYKFASLADDPAVAALTGTKMVSL